MTSFNDLNLAAPLTKALAAADYQTPTPIQAQAIPVVLDGHDLLGIAQTGTGKTAAFALPLLDRIANNPRPLRKRSVRMLVLSPTRELAGQITESFGAYARNMRVSTLSVFGGAPIRQQIRRLERGVDILVATPGRLLDLLNQKALTLADVEMLVLDEADQMLDRGFVHDLRKIVALLPKERQTLFFSATMPAPIASLSKQFLRDPVKVSVTPVASTAEKVVQFATFVKPSDKQALLNKTLEGPGIDRVLVFTRTKHGADRVVKNLSKANIDAVAIHGNKSQPQRERALKSFKNGKCSVLVATDIAARGIDVSGVSHVINFEMPNIAEQYVHRIGRTARAGREGVAISFVANDERPYLRSVERLTRQRVRIEPLPDGFVKPGANGPAHSNDALEETGGVGDRPAKKGKKPHRKGQSFRGGKKPGQKPAGQGQRRAATDGQDEGDQSQNRKRRSGPRSGGPANDESRSKRGPAKRRRRPQGKKPAQRQAG